MGVCAPAPDDPDPPDLERLLSAAGDLTAAPPEVTMMDSVDAMTYAVLDDPGVFMIVWAWCGRLHLAPLATMLVTIAIQVTLPAIVVVQNSHYLSCTPSDTPSGVRLAVLGLMFFLASTCVESAWRLHGMVVLGNYVPGRTWALWIGWSVKKACISLTMLATFVLFKKSPDLHDLLLNSVALNFLLSVDSSMVGLLQCGPNSIGKGLIGAKLRLDKVREAWPNSAQRAEHSRLTSLRAWERWRSKPLLACAAFASIASCVGLYVAPFVATACM